MGEMVALPRRQTLADKAYAELKSRILQSVLRPGAKLSIDTLAKQLLISQTPIREALARLEIEGLVERRALIGYTVTPLLGEEEFEDLFRMRNLLEPLAAQRAAEWDPPAHRPNISAVLHQLCRTPAYPRDADPKLGQMAFTEADERFHRYVAELSGSPMLAKSIERLHSHLHLHRSYIAPKAIAETEEEHHEIADAIIEGQALTARRAMLRHLANSRKRHEAAFRRAEAVMAAEHE